MSEVAQMNSFLNKIPLGNILPEEVFVLEGNICAVVKERKEDHSFWREKEMNLQLQVIHQQLKLITDSMPDRPLVSKKFWGHR